MVARVKAKETRTTDGKGGLAGMRKRVLALGLGLVHVGVPAGAKESETGESLAVIAATHEFGSPARGIPERSFLRASVRVNRKRYVKLAENGAKKVAAGSMDARKVYNLIGAGAAGDVQEYMREGNFAPLKPATIARKKSSKPLIDTGQLRQSITFIVKEN